MILKFGSLVIAEKITSENWRDFVVGASIRQDPATAKPTQIPIDNGFLYYRARAVSAGEAHGANQNGDYFPEEELKKSFKTFIGRGIYCNHDSQDTRKAVGIILDSIWHEKGKYVECLLAIDKSSDIADNVERGISTDVSMGAMVSECQCSVPGCDKVAHTEDEYCDHLAHYMTKEYNGHKVYAINKGVNFYELSFVTVGADKDAKAIERLAALSTDNFKRMEKLAADYIAIKEAAEPDKDNPTVKKELPKPPAAPKKEHAPNDIQDIVEKEVDKTWDHALVDKVRQKLEEQHLEKTLPISDQELAVIIKQKVEERRPRMGGADNIFQRIQSVVEAAIEDKEKESKDQKVGEIDLGDSFIVKPTQVKEQKLVELIEKGKPTGIFTAAVPAETPAEKAVEEYRKRFLLEAEPEKETHKPKKEQEKDAMSEKLEIRYVPGASLDNSYFVGTKGLLQTTVAASKLLDIDTQKDILKAEAAKGVEFGVGDAAAPGTEKEDSEHILGKEKSQPGELVKGPRVTTLQKGVGDAAAPGTEKPDSEHTVGKDPIQPSDMVKKYASIAGNSILRLAKAWGTTPTAIVTRTARIANDPSGWSRETKAPEAKPGDARDNKNRQEMAAREFRAGDGKPEGNLGNEIRTYFGKLNPKNLEQGGNENWAKKVASLQNKVKETEAKLQESELKRDLTAKQLEQQVKEAAEKERGQLIANIVSAEEAVGYITASEDTILEWRDRGLGVEEAEIKAYADAVDSHRKKLAAMSTDALYAVAEMITSYKALPKKGNGASQASNVPEIYIDREAELETEEQKLTSLWLK